MFSLLLKKKEQKVFSIVIMVDDHPYSSLWWMTTHILPKYNPLIIKACDPSYTLLSLHIQDCEPIKKGGLRPFEEIDAKQ